VLRSARVLDDDAAFRLAAQLNLVEAAQPIMLAGSWSRAVTPLRAIVPHVSMFVGDSTTVLVPDDGVSMLRLPPAAFPLASGALRGLALDAAHASTVLLAHAARIVRAKGRLVVPAAVALDASSWKVLATDDNVLVAERLAVSSAPVQLRRAPSEPLFDV
jgi:hypothetical protein